MLSSVGNLLILTNILITISLIFICYNCTINSNKSVPQKIYQLSLFQSTISIITFFTLIVAFIISDFSLVTVYQNSHSLKPIFYKISGSWGNHEGSLLLWINVLSIFSFLFLVFNRSSSINYKAWTLLAQNSLILGFLLFLFVNSNPFSLIVPTPNEGLGLNPILQDPALAIHPPLLYVGFVGSSIYFSAAIGSLMSNFNGKLFADSIKIWVIISWIFQTLGIIVGSIWAYYELGWGGFWFWDPVENASLMPWFVMTALMHSVLVLQKRESLYSWVIILCLSTFILSVTGTFLVRSGILNSVHTFANDPSRGLYILIFLSLMILISLGIFFNKNKREFYSFNLNSRETLILFNNWFMAFYLITVLVGTIFPIFTEVIGQNKISVGPPFYNIVIVPFLIPFLFIMGIAGNTKWIKSNLSFLKIIIPILILSVLINFLITHYFRSYSILSNMIIISSIFLILYSLNDLIKFFIKKKLEQISRVIAHLGFALMIFFISINHNFSTEFDFNLKVGEERKFDNYKISFESLQLDERKNYKAVVGKFDLIDLKSFNIEKLRPEIRIYKQPETLTYEASIKSKIFYDLYITMSNINRSDLYNIKFQKKPFMLWIWLSAILICIGGAVRILKNEN
jgi:cytochrome c-type biogenesis protein CcmF